MGRAQRRRPRTLGFVKAHVSFLFFACAVPGPGGCGITDAPGAGLGAAGTARARRAARAQQRAMFFSPLTDAP
jgi:hypothetical protein